MLRVSRGASCPGNPMEIEMRSYLLPNDNAPDLSFDGSVIATVSSRKNEGPRSERWTVLILYKTDGGLFVCQRIGKTTMPGEIEKSEVATYADALGVVNFFGYGWLSKDLYRNAGIHVVDRVE